MPSSFTWSPFLWDRLGVQGPTLPRGCAVLDSHAGTGGFLEHLRTRFPGIQTYGMNTNAQQALQARRDFPDVPMLVAHPGHNVKAPDDAFGAAFVPDLADAEAQIWYPWLWRHLAPGGVVWALVADSHVPDMFARSLRGFRWRVVYRPNYGQAVLAVGMTRINHRRKTALDEKILRQLARPEAAGIERHLLQLMAEAPAKPDHHAWRAWSTLQPPTRVTPVEPFQTVWRTPDELALILENSPWARETVQEALAAPDPRLQLPPLPLKPGHLALSLVTGQFDGPVGQGPDRHVVRGRVVRLPVPTVEHGPDGPVDIVADYITLQITAVDHTGALRRFGTEVDALTDADDAEEA